MAIPWGTAASAAAPAGLTDAQKLKNLEDRFQRWTDAVQRNELADRRYAGGRVASIDLQQAQRAMMRSGGSINASNEAFAEREHWMRQANRRSAFDDSGAMSGASNRTAFGNAFKTGW